MKKEEEILNYAENEHKRIAERVDDTYAEAYERGIINGALWADEHPEKGLVSIDEVCMYLEDKCVNFFDAWDNTSVEKVEWFIKNFREDIEDVLWK